MAFPHSLHTHQHRLSSKYSYSEQELVTQLRQRNGQAYVYLYDTYASALYTCILQMVKEEDMAADVATDAFLRIRKEITHYDASKERLFTWLSKMARRVALEKMQQGEQRFQKFDPDGDGTTPKEARALLDHCGLKAVTHGLNKEQATLINLSYFGGLTNEQIADTLKVPAETVQQKMYSTLTELNQLLK